MDEELISIFHDYKGDKNNIYFKALVQEIKDRNIELWRTQRMRPFYLLYRRYSMLSLIIGLIAIMGIGSFFGIILFLISYKLDKNNL